MYRYYIHLFLSFQTLHAAFGVFFHEGSHLVLKPDGGSQETFGFSLAYQGGSQTNLVTGAPHSGLTGKVFKCPLGAVLTSKPLKCTEAVIDVDKLAPYSRGYAPDVKLNLGYSVSATPDYFFTCAPLWTAHIKDDPVNYTDYSMGTCFVYNDTAQRYKGYMETLGDEVAPIRIRGGNGWRTLIDQDSQMLVIAKVIGLKRLTDVTYVDSTSPLDKVVSLMSGRKENVNYFKNYWNVGFSLVAGKFFDSKTMFAISSMHHETNRGFVNFLYTKATRRAKNMYLLKTGSNSYVKINSTNKERYESETYEAGSMFGAAMSSANLNLDHLSELVVGAPAQENKDEGVYEAGAVHIYLGGAMKYINDISRHRVILGNKERSRFGTAIAANDIDGDYLSELFISAPYEGSNRQGALYILSGSEIYEKLMKTGAFAKISMSQLTQTQRIENSEFKTFGYSLQVIPDVDMNGCDELAVGSPGSQNIMLLRCLPSVNVTIEANHIGNQTTVHDTSFTIQVCVTVEDLKNRSFPMELIVTNDVRGAGAYIEAHQRTITMNILGKSTKERKCEDVIVQLSDNELGEYVIYTSVKVDDVKIMNNDLAPSSAVLSPAYSTLEVRERVLRHCKGSDCKPNLSMDLTWTEGNISDSTYILGSSDFLVARLLVSNSGNSSWGSCALVRVTGATVAKFGCSEHLGQYKCYMPTPLQRNATYPINIKLNMSRPTNADDEIEVHVILQDFCGRPESGTPADKTFRMKIEFDTKIVKDVQLNGFYKDRHISDTEIQNRTMSNVTDVHHEYWIENNGNVTWNDVTAEVILNVKPFIQMYRVHVASNECTREDEQVHNITFTCKFKLAPRSKVKIIASTDISKDKIMGNLKDNKLTVESEIGIFKWCTSCIANKTSRLSTTVFFQKEQSLAQNKNLIIFLAILGAMLALALLIFILYKVKFFKRTQKALLEELKTEHVRRQSVKRSMSMQTDTGGVSSVINEEGDDSAFENNTSDRG